MVMVLPVGLLRTGSSSLMLCELDSLQYLDVEPARSLCVLLPSRIGAHTREIHNRLVASSRIFPPNVFAYQA